MRKVRLPRSDPDHASNSLANANLRSQLLLRAPRALSPIPIFSKPLHLPLIDARSPSRRDHLPRLTTSTMPLSPSDVRLPRQASRASGNLCRLLTLRRSGNMTRSVLGTVTMRKKRKPRLRSRAQLRLGRPAKRRKTAARPRMLASRRTCSVID